MTPSIRISQNTFSNFVWKSQNGLWNQKIEQIEVSLWKPENKEKMLMGKILDSAHERSPISAIAHHKKYRRSTIRGSRSNKQLRFQQPSTSMIGGPAILAVGGWRPYWWSTIHIFKVPTLKKLGSSKANFVGIFTLVCCGCSIFVFAPFYFFLPSLKVSYCSFSFDPLDFPFLRRMFSMYCACTQASSTNLCLKSITCFHK